MIMSIYNERQNNENMSYFYDFFPEKTTFLTHNLNCQFLQKTKKHDNALCNAKKMSSSEHFAKGLNS